MFVEMVRVFVEMFYWVVLDLYYLERGVRRMYKMGDLVRYNLDGLLIYLG